MDHEVVVESYHFCQQSKLISETIQLSTTSDTNQSVILTNGFKSRGLLWMRCAHTATIQNDLDRSIMRYELPRLTPLQSRLLASTAALVFLTLTYWFLSDAHFAYAAELDVDGTAQSRGSADHNWRRIQGHYPEDERDGLDALAEDGALRRDGLDDASLEPRQLSQQTIQGNDVGNVDNILPGHLTIWRFPAELLRSRAEERSEEDGSQHVELRRRDTVEAEEKVNDLEKRQGEESRTIYISVNTCLQPDYDGILSPTQGPPQLELYVATSAQNTDPGRTQGNTTTQVALQLDQGFAQHAVRATGDWHMAVRAPALPGNFSGVWNYQIAVSTTSYFHSVSSDPNLFLVDSDYSGALMVTNNLTQDDASSSTYTDLMSRPPPFTIFANNVNFTKTLGLSKSYCGLNTSSQVFGRQTDLSGDTTNVQMQMTTRGLGNKPKEQFYITYLNSSTNYTAVLANTSTSGGSTLYLPVPFRTKTDNNCALLFNLTFCSEVAYSVPSTPQAISNYTSFQKFYDNYTLTFYQNFNYSLQQIPCHTTPDAQYSLVKTCADCAQAYKDWLCAVSIPRCEDFSNPAPYLQPRNMGQAFFNGSSLAASRLSAPYHPMSDAPTLPGSNAFEQTFLSSRATNSSRNLEIDRVIAPGPYNEVLPCEDLCYGLVQSCPAALGFGCPYPGRGLERSYGKLGKGGKGTLSCSYLGAVVYDDAAVVSLTVNMRWLWASVGFAVVVLGVW